MVATAELVCSVEHLVPRQRCVGRPPRPSRSRGISPSRITSGSWRRIERRMTGKVSPGSSRTSTCPAVSGEVLDRVLDGHVVLAPAPCAAVANRGWSSCLPVGPVARMMPCGGDQPLDQLGLLLRQPEGAAG